MLKEIDIFVFYSFWRLDLGCLDRKKQQKAYFNKQIRNIKLN